MPRFAKGSQEARDYMKSIREKKTTTSTIEYETSSGKKSKKNITINLDKHTEHVPSKEEPVITPAEITAENVVLPMKKPRQKYATDEERKQAKREQTLASNKRKREERRLAKMEGDGVVKDIIEGAKKAGRKTKKALEKGADVISDTAKNLAQKTKETAQKVIKDVKDYGTAVIKGRNDYPPKVREILDKYGEEEVYSLTIMRTPVPDVLTGALSLFSAGEFGRRMKNAFDTLFHLFLEIRTRSGRRISVEKNEVINMDVAPKKRPETETKVVSNIPSGLSINEMMNNTKEYQGGKFFKYSAYNNNCQDFIVAIFKSNNIGNDEDIKFIKQDTEQLFKDLPSLRKIANTVTDLGAAVNTAITGKGNGTYKKDYVVQSIIINKDKYNLVEARRWLKQHGYPIPKVDSKGEFYRFRQLRPEVVEKMGFTEYRTKNLGNSGVQLILVYKPKEKVSRKNIMKGSGAIPTQVIVEREMSGSGMCCSMCGCKMEHEMTGGKIKVSKALKKLGRDIKKGIEKEVVNPIKKDIQKEFIDPAKKVVEGDIGGYVTAKKGGLASDLVKFGIPAVTGGLAGMTATALTGNPVAGMAASAVGSKLGSLASKEVAKATGTGMPKRKGRFEKGSPEARAHMEMIRKMKSSGRSLEQK
jgi:hypothetical protein